MTTRLRQIATVESYSTCDNDMYCHPRLTLTSPQIMQKRATEEPRQRAHALYTMWEHLEPAAKKAGVPVENLRAQLTEECVQVNSPVLYVLI